MAHGENALARLQKVTKNPAATLLLLRILNWYKYGKGRQIEGKKWTPNSLSEWAVESGLTKQQVRSAFKVFHDTNLVESAILVYRTRKTLHTRPTQRAVALSEGNAWGNFDDCAGQTPSSEQHGIVLSETLDGVPSNTGACSEQHAYIHGGEHGGEQLETTGVPVGPQEVFGVGNKTAGKEEPMKMSEALKAAKSHGMIHKPDTASALAFVWKKHVSEKYGVMVGLTVKAQGQLGHLLKVWPEGKAEAILADVLTHWVTFTKKVEAEAGIKVTPVQPECGFLLKYASIAAIFAQSLHLTSKMVQTGQEAPKDQSPTPPLQLTSIIEKPLTYEEALAIMKGP